MNIEKRYEKCKSQREIRRIILRNEGFVSSISMILCIPNQPENLCHFGWNSGKGNMVFMGLRKTQHENSILVP